MLDRNTKRFVRRNKMNIFFGGCTLFVLAISGESMVQTFHELNRIRGEIGAQNSKISTLNNSLEFEKQQAEIANQRYKEGCLPIVEQTVKNGKVFKYSSIREGQTILDRFSGEPLAVGTVVCDGHGATGVINDSGVVANVAFTGDRSVVAARSKRFRGGEYTQPVRGQN